MPQCTSATFSRVERAGPGERHARPDRPPPSIDRWTGRISTNDTSRRRHDGIRRAPEPIRSGRGGARLGGVATVSHWDIEHHEVVVEFDGDHVRDLQADVRRMRGVPDDDSSPGRC